MPTALAIDIGGTHFRLAVFDHTGSRLGFQKGATLRSGGREWMLAELQRRGAESIGASAQPVERCGVSFGGPVDFRRQTVTSVHTPGWEDFALGDWVERALGIPCVVDNDANAGALGESRFGVARGAESMMYVTLSTGIGSGIVCRGHLHRGRDGMAGEIGHFPLQPAGELCTCGLKTGCTEALASGRALDRLARELAMREAHSAESRRPLLELCQGLPERATAKELILAAQAGDADALAIFREAIAHLAHALLMAIRLLNPDKIVLGGGVTQSGPFLIESVRSALKEWWSDQFPYTTEIAVAGLGDESPLYGAAALAFDAELTGKH